MFVYVVYSPSVSRSRSKASPSAQSMEPVCTICFAPLIGESTTQVFITTIGSAHTHIHTVASIDRHVQLQTQEPTCCNVCVFMCVCVSVCMCLPCSLEVEALLCGHTFHTDCIGPWTAMRGPNSCIYRCQLPVADPDFMVMPPVEGESTVPHIEGESTLVLGDDDLDRVIDVDVDAVAGPEDIDRDREDLIARALEETYALASEAGGSSDSSSNGS